MSDHTTPQTPVHLAPDTEVLLPLQSFQSDVLDLNPDLDDQDDALDDNTETSSNATALGIAWTEPFDEALLRLTEITEKNSSPRLTMPQQSKLITFLDGQLLQVHRKFIKNQAENYESYPLVQLITDLEAIVNVIWCLVNHNTELFGQEEYLIRILGDVEDWIMYYDLPTLSAKNPSSLDIHKCVFLFFQSLDTRLSFLIDGYQVNERHTKLSATEIVRLNPIVNRIRFAIINKVEKSRAHLLKENWNENSAAKSFMNVLETEVGRLLEGTIERF